MFTISVQCYRLILLVTKRHMKFQPTLLKEFNDVKNFTQNDTL